MAQYVLYVIVIALVALTAAIDCPPGLDTMDCSLFSYAYGNLCSGHSGSNRYNCALNHVYTTRTTVARINMIQNGMAQYVLLCVTVIAALSALIALAAAIDCPTGLIDSNDCVLFQQGYRYCPGTSLTTYNCALDFVYTTRAAVARINMMQNGNLTGRGIEPLLWQLCLALNMTRL